MATHDENRDLKSLAKVAKINYGNKTIQCPKTAQLGIALLGKIDYLVNHCGWHFVYNNDATVNNRRNITNDDDKKSVREAKKERKAAKLTDKTKKQHKTI